MHRFNRRPIQTSIRGSGAEEPDRFTNDLREALSHWASSVCIVGASDGDELDAITVTAFAGVSIDPPLVLTCIANHVSILPMMREEQRFTISILSKHQQPIASGIAQRLPGFEDHFVAIDDPTVRGAVATLRCTLWEDYPGGDHRIVVGHVEAVALGEDAAPLVYYRRGYVTEL